jgi:predicted porin
MNNKIKLAVAGSVLALSATANAGIIIPAGDWTIDVNGNVNAFAIWSSADDTTAINGGAAQVKDSVANGSESNSFSINTGLLPSWLGFTGTTRANDLDVSWTISMQPGASTAAPLSSGGGNENRQAFVTFGDKSWGTVKVGKDLGIFASTAILNDMTLLGVGSQAVVGHGGGTTTTLGGIGTGYIYADWKGQMSYTTPNMNGFQATIGIVQPYDATTAGTAGTQSATNGNNTGTASHTRPGYEGQASYSWSGDVAGKVWAGFASQKMENLGATANHQDETINVYEIGANLNVGNLGLVGYWYDGRGVGTTAFGRDGFNAAGDRRDSDGGYLQATYVIPTGTKLGVAYGVSNLDKEGTSDAASTFNLVEKNERWTVGAYHPLTKHLNLVAEYNDIQSEAMGSAIADNDQSNFSVGAILFF